MLKYISMCCIINKIKNWFTGKKEVCNKSEIDFLKKASLSKEEVDNVIINSLKKVKQKKPAKTKVQKKSKLKIKNKKPKR